MALNLAAFATPRADYDAEFGTGVAAQWDDQSGNGFHCTQPTAGFQPTITPNVWGSLPAYRFTSAASKHWLIPAGVFTALSECEVFIAFSIDADPPASSGALIKTGSHGGAFIDAHPYVDGYLYSDFCSTVRKDTIARLSDGTRRSFTGSRAHVMNIRSRANEWVLAVDGQVLRYTTTNTFGVGSVLQIGAGGTTGGSGAMLGYIGRVFLTSTFTSDTVRKSITEAMMGYYGSYPKVDLYKYAIDQEVQQTRRSSDNDGTPMRSNISRSRMPLQKIYTRGWNNGLTDAIVDARGGSLPGDAAIDLKDEQWERIIDSKSIGGTIQLGEGGGGGVPDVFIMRAVETGGGCAVPTYRFWTSSGSPDYSGAAYTGPRCTPPGTLTDITVIGKIDN